MAEELIPGPFVKYTNNTSPEPLPNLSPDEEYRAEFLCFAQHVQWEKTGQLAFISDFQGMIYLLFTRCHSMVSYSIGGAELLTDPQVITSPYVILIAFAVGLEGH